MTQAAPATEKKKRNRKPRVRTAFGMAEDAKKKLDELDAKIAKAQAKVDEATEERDELVEGLTDEVKGLLGIPDESDNEN